MLIPRVSLVQIRDRRIKVRGQSRAGLIKDEARTGNYWRWVDMPPPVGAALQKRRDKLRHHFHSGFVAQHGALFGPSSPFSF